MVLMVLYVYHCLIILNDTTLCNRQLLIQTPCTLSEQNRTLTESSAPKQHSTQVADYGKILNLTFLR